MTSDNRKISPFINYLLFHARHLEEKKSSQTRLETADRLVADFFIVNV